MAFAPFIPLITGGVSALTSFFGGNSAAGKAARENQRARQWQYEMWKFNNEYNTPAMQKQRLIDAGLSPSLMYQTMPQNVSQSFDQPAGDPTVPARIQAEGINNAVNSLQTGANAVVQNELIRAQTAAILQDIEQKKSTNPLQVVGMTLDNKQKDQNIIKTELENELKRLENQYGNEYFLLRNKGMRLNTDQLSKAISYMDENQKLFVREKLQTIFNLAQQTKTLKSQEAKNLSDVERNKTLQALDELERQYRTKGMSFNDFIVFRELKSTMMNMFEGISKSVGKNNNETTIVQALARTIINLLVK